MNDFTIVTAVDRRHLQELAVSYPTWIHYRPSWRERPMLIIHDQSVTLKQITAVCDHPNLSVTRCIEYGFSGQRAKMLSALGTLPAWAVKTPYYLKIDTDTVADCGDSLELEQWLDPKMGLAIVAPRWGYTKPAELMERLDSWASLTMMKNAPRVKWTRERRRDCDVARCARIISYWAFVNTSWHRALLNDVGIRLHIPVPSQDTFLWYCAARLDYRVGRISDAGRFGLVHCGGNMKKMKEIARNATRRLSEE